MYFKQILLAPAHNHPYQVSIVSAQLVGVSEQEMSAESQGMIVLKLGITYVCSVSLPCTPKHRFFIHCTFGWPGSESPRRHHFLRLGEMVARDRWKWKWWVPPHTWICVPHHKLQKQYRMLTTCLWVWWWFSCHQPAASKDAIIDCLKTKLASRASSTAMTRNCIQCADRITILWPFHQQVTYM